MLGARDSSNQASVGTTPALAQWAIGKSQSDSCKCAAIKTREVAGNGNANGRKQFLNGLRGRPRSLYQGQRVDVVTDHRRRTAARNTAIDFELAQNPNSENSTCIKKGNEKIFRLSEYLGTRRSLERSQLIELGTKQGATLATVNKEIGTDAILPLKSVLAKRQTLSGLERIDAFYRECREGIGAAWPSGTQRGSRKETMRARATRIFFFFCIFV